MVESDALPSAKSGSASSALRIWQTGTNRATRLAVFQAGCRRFESGLPLHPLHLHRRGINQNRRLADLTDELVERSLSVNPKGALFMAKHASMAMAKSGTPLH